MGNYNEAELQAWGDLIRFQLNVADRWLERGNKSEDIFAKFLFYFTGFNAVYFLFRKIDRLDQTNEGKHIENLIWKFDEAKAKEILAEIKASIHYFCRHRPIYRMDRRTDKELAGDQSEGRKWRKRLQDSNLSPSERLAALAQILYLVRSNLVHGSKAESGDDWKIIESSIDPLKVLLEESISWTHQECF